MQKNLALRSRQRRIDCTTYTNTQRFEANTEEKTTQNVLISLQGSHPMHNCLLKHRRNSPC